MRTPKNPKMLEAVIRSALSRELRKMHDREIYGSTDGDSLRHPDRIRETASDRDGKAQRPEGSA
jgi:hypothetical protein